MKKLSFLIITTLYFMTIQEGFGQGNLGMSEKMQNAYDISNEIVKERLAQEDKENIEILESIKSEDLVVVDGTYDHIHQVLSALKMPFTRVSQNQLMAMELKPSQTVFVNCASNFPPEAARKLASFVQAGGQLITTDWALQNVLEVGFPGYVAFNQAYTGDEVVRIEVLDREDPVIKGFLDEKSQPVWWLEGSSYPIKVLAPEKVTVLIRSKELKERYGEEAVIVRFNHGKGVVYHMISHFYLQRTETKDATQAGNSTEYFKDKNVSSEKLNKLENDERAKSLNYGEIQSANTSAEFIQRSVLEQKKRILNAEKEPKKDDE